MSGYQRVVLVGQRDVLGTGRGERERALEVAVEAEARRARDDEASVVSEPASIAAKRSGLEQSSLITQTQLRWVCARIDSIWRSNSSIGGS